VIRLHDPADPTRRRLYALVRPSGEIFVGDGGQHSSTLREIVEAIDAAATPPETLAVLYTTLVDESAVVRCLPGSNDVLPTEGVEVLRARTCQPPARVTADGRALITMVVEEFPDPGSNRESHRIWFKRVEVTDDAIDSVDGEALIELDPAAPRPPELPPLPEMTAPPDWVAAPEKTPPAVSDALCAVAREKLSGFAGRRCEAYGYPSLVLPTGQLFYLANDAGYRWAWALRKLDGAILAGWDLVDGDPIAAIVADYERTRVPPAVIVAAHLMLDGSPARILCLPGADDVIPGHDCTPPSATKEGDELVVTAILHELPLPRDKYAPKDPAIRQMTWRFSPRGGYSGDGWRLIDLREDPSE
jgi:hypothetical protein